MKYRVTLNGKIYEVEVADGEAVLLDTYEANLPAAPAPAVQPRHRQNRCPLDRTLPPARWSKPLCLEIFCRSRFKRDRRFRQGRCF